MFEEERETARHQVELPSTIKHRGPWMGAGYLWGQNPGVWSQGELCHIPLPLLPLAGLSSWPQDGPWCKPRGTSSLPSHNRVHFLLIYSAVPCVLSHLGAKWFQFICTVLSLTSPGNFNVEPYSGLWGTFWFKFHLIQILRVCLGRALAYAQKSGTVGGGDREPQRSHLGTDAAAGLRYVPGFLLQATRELSPVVSPGRVIHLAASWSSASVGPICPQFPYLQNGNDSGISGWRDPWMCFPSCRALSVSLGVLLSPHAICGLPWWLRW